MTSNHLIMASKSSLEAKENIHKHISSCSKSLTFREHNCLGSLENNRDDKDAGTKERALRDENLFLDSDDPAASLLSLRLYQRQTSVQSLPHILSQPTRSCTREVYKQNRRECHLRAGIWKAHESGISTNGTMRSPSFFRRNHSAELFTFQPLPCTDKKKTMRMSLRAINNELEDGKSVPTFDSTHSRHSKGASKSKNWVESAVLDSYVLNALDLSPYSSKGVFIPRKDLVEQQRKGQKVKRYSDRSVDNDEDAVDFSELISNQCEENKVKQFGNQHSARIFNASEISDHVGENVMISTQKKQSRNNLDYFFLDHLPINLAEKTEAVTDYEVYDNAGSLNDDDADSWGLHTYTGNEDYCDPWRVLYDEYAIDYYGKDTLPFRILGTSANDVSAHPHVLSPPLMESLQSFFPPLVSEANFWMKFSLVRDGDSLSTLIRKVHGATHTILAIETVDGEVFGSFTSTAWSNNHSYFGSGESFLWRIREARTTPCYSIIDQAQLESELDVYPWAGKNDYVQLCTKDKIALGGGDLKGEVDKLLPMDKEAGGYGLAIDSNLYHGTSSPCETFNNPCLSKQVNSGDSFDIANVEVWALTYGTNADEAEKMESRRLFLEKNRI